MCYQYKTYLGAILHSSFGTQVLQIRLIFNIHRTFPFGPATLQLLNSHVPGLESGPSGGDSQAGTVAPLSCPTVGPLLMRLGSLWLPGEGGYRALPDRAHLSGHLSHSPVDARPSPRGGRWLPGWARRSLLAGGPWAREQPGPRSGGGWYRR